jgi:hypothetical protein
MGDDLMHILGCEIYVPTSQSISNSKCKTRILFGIINIHMTVSDTVTDLRPYCPD